MKRRKKKAATTAAIQSPPPVSTSQVSISNVEEFQAAYGDEWIKIVSHPAFQAGMLLGDVQKLKSIQNLTDADIEKDGKIILADLRGHLALEQFLMTLHTARDFKFPTEQERYLKPEEAVELEDKIQEIQNRRKQ